MSKNGSISASVIKRLPRYYRFLGELKKQGVDRISSRELSQRMKLTASQIRQDLNCFGGFGQQGYGYHVDELRKEIGKILGVDKRFRTILIGAGNLGRAIATHINFGTRGCELVGIFDSNEQLVGRRVGELNVMNIADLRDFCDVNHPTVAVLCIPKAATQQIADTLVSMGIKAFWNFSHYDLSISYDDIIVENVHLGDSLLTLTYGVNVLMSGSEDDGNDDDNDNENEESFDLI
jgi:redox-sensing transcriptional repressor